MARSARNSRLENRTQRIKLKESHRPYWVGIGQGLYLGYRKGIKGGAWIVRCYADKKYITEKLGKADDYQDANNIDVLDYFQAQAKARDYADNKAKAGRGITGKGFTVGEAISNYVEWFKTHRKSFSRTQHVAKIHILPKFDKVLVSNLTTKAIRDWHESLAKQPPKLRSTPIKQKAQSYS
jgi:ribosome-associated translation inhibitor RaiA